MTRDSVSHERYATNIQKRQIKEEIPPLTRAIQLWVQLHSRLTAYRAVHLSEETLFKNLVPTNVHQFTVRLLFYLIS